MITRETRLLHNRALELAGKMTEMKRHVIQARLLGLDKNATKRGRVRAIAS